MKKRILVILLALSVCLSVSFHVFAAAVTLPKPDVVIFPYEQYTFEITYDNMVAFDGWEVTFCLNAPNAVPFVLSSSQCSITSSPTGVGSTEVATFTIDSNWLHANFDHGAVFMILVSQLPDPAWPNYVKSPQSDPVYFSVNKGGGEVIILPTPEVSATDQTYGFEIELTTQFDFSVPYNGFSLWYKTSSQSSMSLLPTSAYTSSIITDSVAGKMIYSYQLNSTWVQTNFSAGTVLQIQAAMEPDPAWPTYRQSYASDPVSFTVLSPAGPPPPSSFYVTFNGSALSWNAVSGATEYVVYQNFNTGNSPQQIAVTSSTSIPLSFDAQTPNGYYQWYVVARRNGQADLRSDYASYIYSDGYSPSQGNNGSYDQGYLAGYNAGYAAGSRVNYEAGYEAGYEIGRNYDDTQSDDVTAIGGFFTRLLGSLTSSVLFLGTNISFQGITILTVLFFIIIGAVVFFIISKIKK